MEDSQAGAGTAALEPLARASTSGPTSTSPRVTATEGPGPDENPPLVALEPQPDAAPAEPRRPRRVTIDAPSDPYNVPERGRQRIRGVHAPIAPSTYIPTWQPQYPLGVATAPAFVPPYAYGPQTWTPAVPGGGHAHSHRGPPLFQSAPPAWANPGASYGASPYGAHQYSAPAASMNPRTTHGLQAQSPFVPLVPQSRTPQAGRDPVQGYGYYSAQHYEDPDPHPDLYAETERAEARAPSPTRPVGDSIVPPPTAYPPVIPHVVPGRTPLAATPSAHALPSQYRPGARTSSPTRLEENWVTLPPVIPEARASSPTSLEENWVIPPPVIPAYIPPPVDDSPPSPVTDDYRPRGAARRARRAPSISIDFEERLRQLRRGRQSGDGVMNYETSRPHTRIPPRPEPEEYESHEGVNNPVTDDVRTDDGLVPDGASQHSFPPAQLRTPVSVADALRENRLAQQASIDQQREIMRYMRGLNNWLDRDVRDRQSELRGVSTRVDQLRQDLAQMAMHRRPTDMPDGPPEEEPILFKRRGSGVPSPATGRSRSASRHSRSRIPPIIPMVIPRPESPLPQPGYVPRVDTPWAAYQVPNSQYPPPVFEARAQGLPAPVRVPYPSLDQHWTTLVNHCKETDEEMFKNWDEEINALLVFAGLFSAVLTAFVVESYQLLQPDNGSTSVLALTAISLQLQALTLGNGSTALPFIQEDPATPISAYVLNALWFIALTASVVSAFFGILLKQALREYNSWNGVAGPIAALELRQLRFSAFSTWKVSVVAASLPALLEFSVILFMAGLPIFLYGSSLGLGIVLIVIAGAFLALCAAATVLPALTKDFPYKNPVAWGFHKLVTECRRLHATLRSQRWRYHITRNTESFRATVNLAMSPTPNFFRSIPADPPPPTTKSEGKTWRERDLAIAKAEERTQLWSLLRWFCASEGLYHLSEPVRMSARELLYGRNTQPTYVDVVNAVPLALMLDEHERESFGPALLDAGGLWDLIGPSFHPHHRTDPSSAAKLRQRIDATPWRLLAILNDELIMHIRTALREGLADVTYSKSDANRSRLVYAFCLLECLFEPARLAHVESAFADSWLSLVLSACRTAVVIHSSPSGEPCALSDLLITRLAHRQLPKPGSNGTVRMLNFVNDMTRADDTQDAHWTASRLRLLSVLSPRALAAAKSELDGSTPPNILIPLIQRTCQVIADVVDYSVQRGIINCGNPDASFPWLDVLPAFIHLFPPQFYDQLASGFNVGTFTSNGDFASQQLLLQFTTAHVPSLGVFVPPLPDPSDDSHSARSSSGRRSITPSYGVHPLLDRGTSLRVDLSAPQLPVELVRLQDGVPVLLTEEELDAPALFPPKHPLSWRNEELSLSCKTLTGTRELSVVPSSQDPGAFITVRDVLSKIHATMIHPIEATIALALEWSSSSSEQAAVASRRSQRVVTHGLPDADPLRLIDFTPGGTFFGGCAISMEGTELHFVPDPAPGLSAASTVAGVADSSGATSADEDGHKSSGPPSSRVFVEETSHPPDEQVDVDVNATVDGEKAEVVDIM